MKIGKFATLEGNELYMKILILSCGTGGGHNSAALAIKEELDRRNIENVFLEYLEIINKRIKNHVNSLYIKSTYRNGEVFKAVYKLGELYRKTKIKSPVYALNSFSKRKLYEYIKENNYDYIITTHLFVAQALTTIKKEHSIHFVAVATDYICIPFWEETNPDYFIVPSLELEKSFLDKNIGKEKLIPIGIPVSKKFSVEYDKSKELENLGMEKNKRYILILTGSMGFGSTKEILEKLIERSSKNDIFIVACGNNERLLQTLKKDYEKDDRIIALPFTNEIYKYMVISDIILSKPGGLTSTEIATLNKPFIHTMPIPGCENYNADYYNEKNMSIKCESIDGVVKNTYNLLNDERLKERMLESQRKYIDKDACIKICDFIIKEIKKLEEKINE